MYVESVHIRNLKLLRDFRLELTNDDGTPRLWTVIVGENGLCKTSILRAIALAAVGPDRANQLADIPSYPDRRLPKPTVAITATYSVQRSDPLAPAGTRPCIVTSNLTIPAGQNLFRGDSAWAGGGIPNPVAAHQASQSPDLGWFIAGYGVHRQLPVALSTPPVTDPVLSRLGPLFDKSQIVGTGFADQLEPDLAREYARLLSRAFVREGILPRVANLVLSGRGGVTAARTLVEANRFAMRIGNRNHRLPATWLSQGYQASIAWIADLVGQIVLQSNRAVPLAEMEGLVLIDELDLFLHPTWQVRLVETLKRAFPRMQFVATTHSPMVLPGLSRDEVVILQDDERGNVVACPARESPKLLTGSEIYSLFFGMNELYPRAEARALERYTFLSADPERTDEEERELQAARDLLLAAGIDLGPPPVRRIPR